MSPYSKRSRKAYDNHWAAVIEPTIRELCLEEGVSCKRPSKAKERIWTAYVAFNKHCSENYMSNSNKPLDRHKVAACYMYAILAAFPLAIDDGVSVDSSPYMANERLAIILGCSILAGFLLETIESVPDETWPGSLDKQRLINRVKSGVPFPEKVGHGDYVKNMTECLCFTAIEKSYNILLLAKLLFHWEVLVVGECYDFIVSVRDGRMGRTEDTHPYLPVAVATVKKTA